jgi:hypothetical protein
MSSADSPAVPSLDLSKWRNAPWILIAVGGAGALIAALVDTQQFAYSWLLTFMFYLSIGLGCWFLVMMHHLFDASWPVAIRRFLEHGACLLCPTLLLLFIPVALLAGKIYPWFAEVAHPDHALRAKFPLFTHAGYYVGVAACFAIWLLFPSRLRFWSLEQDRSGSAECTRHMRFYSSLGIVLFALTLTLAAIMWISGLMDEWYSTMFGVWYFAASVWTTLATVYVITLVMQRATPLRALIKEKTYYMIGSLFLAFTVFWAYISFAQYFIVWNANMPEETFWYVLREKGSWDVMGKYIIIFGHFFIPFLMLLRIDWKLKLATMLPLCAWAWLMHFCDLQFQIMPALRQQGFLSAGLLGDVACMMFFGGVLAKVFIASVLSCPLYPQKDPRIAETMDIYVPPHSDISIAPGGAK